MFSSLNKIYKETIIMVCSGSIVKQYYQSSGLAQNKFEILQNEFLSFCEMRFYEIDFSVSAN